MENEKTKVDLLVEHVEDYFKTRQELSKLIAAEKAGVVLSSVITNLILLCIFLFVFLFASIALAFGISQLLGQHYAGFLIVAGLYFLIGIILFAKRKQWLMTPMANAVIKNFFKNENDEQD
jgi:hypothetical protein